MVQAFPKHSAGDDEFLLSAAAKILGGSFVGTASADSLARDGIDAKRLLHLLRTRDCEINVGVFKFGRVES